MNPAVVDENAISRVSAALKAEAERGGYFLNPDADFVASLVRGLLKNEQRYGYRACPCRLASGIRAEDLDIICPCIYRDPDLDEFSACYCALYVSGPVARGADRSRPVPERRPSRQARAAKAAARVVPSVPLAALPLPLWRCTVCGYLCAREHPPEICPICRAGKERFERFI